MLLPEVVAVFLCIFFSVLLVKFISFSSNSFTMMTIAYTVVAVYSIRIKLAMDGTNWHF